MTIAFEQLQEFAFNRIPFLVESYEVRGGLRDHVHEYPHSPGGDPETMGRKLYTVSVNAVFVDNTPRYPTAWPLDRSQLMNLFEAEARGPLLIPTIGTMRAYAFDWTLTAASKMRNGERFKLEFREDQQVDLVADSSIAPNYTAVATKASALVDALATSGIKADIFTVIADLSSQIQGYVDSVNLDVSLLATKVDQLSDACRTADAIVTELDAPSAWPVVDALHDLGVTADNLNRDVLQQSLPLLSFTTPSLMSIVDVSRSIFNDTSYAMEIMQMNALDDPLSIPANTVLRAYAHPVLQAA